MGWRRIPCWGGLSQASGRCHSPLQGGSPPLPRTDAPGHTHACTHRCASMFYKYTQGQAKYVHPSVSVPPPHVHTHAHIHTHTQGQAERDSRTWSRGHWGWAQGGLRLKGRTGPRSTPRREARDQAGLGTLANQGVPPPYLGSLPCPPGFSGRGGQGGGAW